MIDMLIGFGVGVVVAVLVCYFVSKCGFCGFLVSKVTGESETTETETTETETTEVVEEEETTETETTKTEKTTETKTNKKIDFVEEEEQL